MVAAVVARSPSLDALLLLSWVQLTWADLRARNHRPAAERLLAQIRDKS